MCVLTTYVMLSFKTSKLACQDSIDYELPSVVAAAACCRAAYMNDADIDIVKLRQSNDSCPLTHGLDPPCGLGTECS